MLRLMKVFTRGVFSLAPFWWGWLGVLMVADVARWIRGDRTPSVTLADI
jgi:hypothetical protein